MTTNHPAHGPVSLNRLHQIRETLSKAAAQSDGGNLGYAMADAVKVIDDAIAARNAKPVAWTDAEELRDMVRDGYGAMLSLNRKDCEHADPSRQILLFTHPAPLRNAEREELQERRKADSAEPVLYVMQGDGFDFGGCTSTYRSAIDDLVNEWNECRNPSIEPYKTVPLYAAPQPAPDSEGSRND